MKKVTLNTYKNERKLMFTQLFVIEKNKKINKLHIQIKVRYIDFFYCLNIGF